MAGSPPSHVAVVPPAMPPRRSTVALLVPDDTLAVRLEGASPVGGPLDVVRWTPQAAVAAVARLDALVVSFPAPGTWRASIARCAETLPIVLLCPTESQAEAWAAVRDDGLPGDTVLGLEEAVARGAGALASALEAAKVHRALRRRAQEAETTQAAARDRSRAADFIIRKSSVVVFRWAPSAGSPVLYVSDNVSVLGYTAAQMMRRDFFYQQIIHPDDLEPNLRRIKEYAESGIDRFVLSYRIITPDEEQRWVEDDTTVERDGEGRVLYHQGLVFDVTARRAAQDQLVRLSQAVEQSPGSVVIADTRGRIEYVNEAFTRLSGYAWEEVVGHELLGFNSDGDSAESRALWQAIWQTTDWSGELRRRRRDGHAYWEAVRISPVRGSNGGVSHFLELGEDISDRKSSEAIIRQMAYYDALTELPNRTLFYDRLSQALAHARRGDRVVGVLFLDLDEFKGVNDTLGHAAGDELLRQVAQRIRGAIREGDTVGRMGGDEFIVVLRDLERPDQAGVVAQKIVNEFHAPFDLGRSVRTVSTSVGVATWPQDGDEPEELVRAADAAMYAAKQAGKNGVALASRGAATPSARRLTLQDLLNQALVRDEFVLRFEPVFDTRAGELVAADAAIRWEHPERGEVQAAEFVPLAEGAGILPEVDRWTLRSVCSAWRRLADAGFGEVRLSARVWDRRFVERPFLGVVRDAIREFGVPAGHIELEIPAEAVADSAALARGALETLRADGARIALSGIRAGRWTVADLRSLPLDRITFERDLVRGLPDAVEDAALVRAVAAFASTVGVALSARGVESAPQRQFVESVGCTTVQGFAYALPMRFDELVTFLRERETRATDSTDARLLGDASATDVPLDPDEPDTIPPLGGPVE